VLQELSDAAEPILVHLMHEEEPSTNIYRIETVEEDGIMAFPKGNQNILFHLTQVPSTIPAQGGW